MGAPSGWQRSGHLLSAGAAGFSGRNAGAQVWVPGQAWLLAGGTSGGDGTGGCLASEETEPSEEGHGDLD